MIHLYALVERDAMKSNHETFDRILMNLKLGVQQLVSQNLMVNKRRAGEVALNFGVGSVLSFHLLLSWAREIISFYNIPF